MKRRKILITAGGIAGAGTLYGSGAFSSVEANRTVSVNTEGDADAYLGFEPLNDDYASLDDDDVLELTFSDDDGADGDGFNPNATTRVDNVFKIINQGTEDVGLEIEKGDIDDGVNELDFLASTDTTGEESLVYDSPVLLETGESVNVSIEIDVETSDEIDGVINDGEITIIADEDERDDADELEPVQNVDTGKWFETIQAAIDDAKSGHTIQVASGVYEESVEISVDGLTLKAADGASPAIAPTTDTDAITVTEEDVTVDGFTIEVDNDATAVDIGSIDDSGDDETTLVNNVFDLTAGSADAVGIDTESATDVQEDISDNEFVGDGIGEVFVDDSTATVLDSISNVEDNNEFDPGVTEEPDDTLVPAVTLAEGDSFDASNDVLEAQGAINPSSDTVLGEGFGSGSGAFEIDNYEPRTNADLEVEAEFDEAVDVDDLDVESVESAFSGDDLVEITGVVAPTVANTADEADDYTTAAEANGFLVGETNNGKETIAFMTELEGKGDNFINNAERLLQDVVDDDEGIERAIEELEKQDDTTDTIELDVSVTAGNFEDDADDQDVTGVTVNGQTIPLSDLDVEE